MRASVRTTGNRRSSTARAARSTSATNVAPYFGAQNAARQSHARIAGSVLGAARMTAANQARFVPSAHARRRGGWNAASAPSAMAASRLVPVLLTMILSFIIPSFQTTDCIV